MVRKWMTFYRSKRRVVKQISWKFQLLSMSISGQMVGNAYRAKGNKSQGFFETPLTLASVTQADKIDSLTSSHSTTNTPHIQY